MASSKLRKAIGTVKDQTSIGIAKVASQTAELIVAIIKATSHDADPPNQRHISQILNLTSYSRLYINACIATVSKRLGKTRNWIVALKSLILIHRLLSDGDIAFQEEFMFATRRGARLLNMSAFRDEAHSNGWDHSAFVRTYALYLDQKLELLVYEKKQNDGDKDSRRPPIAVSEMNAVSVLGRMNQLQSLLDRLLACRPIGLAKNCRLVYVALYPIVIESFKIYGDICEVLSVLLDRFFDMEYTDSVKAFEAYASVAKQIDELVGFYNWCKGSGVARGSEFPEVQRITDKLLETLEEFLRDRATKPESPMKKEETTPVEEVREEVPISNEIKALPAPDDYTNSPDPEVKEQEETKDLIDITDDTTSTEDPSNMFALALFQGNVGNNSEEANSAWEIADKDDWELALVESASKLSNQKVTLAGGFDPLLLNGMYDQGMVRQHMSTAQLSGGSASSVALPGFGKSGTPVLALPAPEGSVQMVGGDPFAASLAIPPPSYVQMADMEKKQQLLVQEQTIWQQYARDGMQGQVSLGKIIGAGAGYYYMQGPQAIVPYGMQPINVVGPGGMQTVNYNGAY